MVLLCVQIGLFLGSLLLSWYLSKSHKPDQPEPAGLDRSSFPTIGDKPIPPVWGRVWLRSPHVVWYGAVRTYWNNHPSVDEEKDGDDTTHTRGAPHGWNYRLPFHLALCHGPVNAIVGMKVARKVVAGLTITSTRLKMPDATELVYDDDGDLVGTAERHPWHDGAFRIWQGGSGQSFVPDFGAELPDSAKPMFLGVVTLTTETEDGLYLGTSPSLKPLEFQVERTTIGVNAGIPGGDIWNKAKAAVYSDDAEPVFVGMNPAHILYELITSPDFGLSDTRIDTASFEAAADALYDEHFGLNMVWETGSSVRDLMVEITKCIEGICWFSMTDNEWKLKLVRDDYTLEDTTLLTDDDVVSLDSYSRPTWVELPNQVDVSYRNDATWDEKRVTLHNQAAQTAQGRVVATSARYTGVTNDGLANRLASRDLKEMGQPLASVKLTLKSTHANLRPGDVVRWTWDDLGIVAMPLRILAVNIGDALKHSVKVRAVEDVFGLGAGLYATPTPSAWVDPRSEPVDTTTAHLYPAPYWLANRAFADAPTLAGADGGWVCQVTKRPVTDSTGYQLDTASDGVNYSTALALASWARTALLTAAVAPGDTALVVDGPVSDDLYPADTLLLVEGATETEDELMAVVSTNSVTRTLTVARGVLDTTPRAHALGARMWVPQTSTVLAGVQAAGTPTLTTKALTITSRGVLAIEDATPRMAPDTAQRYQKPYPPGRLRINGAAYPASIVRDEVLVEWAHRDRILQGEDVRGEEWAEQPSAESGVFYRVFAYDESDVEVYASGDLAGTVTSATIDSALFPVATSLRIVVQAIRDEAGTEVPAWQSASATVAVTD